MPDIIAENSWYRYGMKKLRHCHFNAWPVPCETYDYLPTCRLSPTTERYQILHAPALSRMRHLNQLRHHTRRHVVCVYMSKN